MMLYSVNCGEHGGKFGAVHERAQPGDFSICMLCGCMWIFASTLVPVPATDEEIKTAIAARGFAEYHAHTWYRISKMRAAILRRQSLTQPDNRSLQ